MAIVLPVENGKERWAEAAEAMVGSRNAATNGALLAYTAAAAVARKRLLYMLTVASILSFNWLRMPFTYY